MSKDKEQIRFTLTPEQQALIKQATGKEADSLELSVRELEERISPGKVGAQGFRMG